MQEACQCWLHASSSITTVMGGGTAMVVAVLEVQGTWPTRLTSDVNSAGYMRPGTVFSIVSALILLDYGLFACRLPFCDEQTQAQALSPTGKEVVMSKLTPTGRASREGLREVGGDAMNSLRSAHGAHFRRTAHRPV